MLQCHWWRLTWSGCNGYNSRIGPRWSSALSILASAIAARPSTVSTGPRSSPTARLSSPGLDLTSRSGARFLLPASGAKLGGHFLAVPAGFLQLAAPRTPAGPSTRGSKTWVKTERRLSVAVHSLLCQFLEIKYHDINGCSIGVHELV